MEKANQCLSTYKTERNFIASFSPDLMSRGYQQYGAERLILSEKAPTITIARATFGNESVNIIIKQNLLKLAIAFGLQTTEEQIEEICSVFVDMAHDLKVSEIYLFFHLMKQNKFRDKRGDDIAKMYGTLSVQSISECLSNYCDNYRARVIDDYEKEKKNREREENFNKSATDEERKQVILEAAKTNPLLMSIAKANGWV